MDLTKSPVSEEALGRKRGKIIRVDKCCVGGCPYREGYDIAYCRELGYLESVPKNDEIPESCPLDDDK